VGRDKSSWRERGTVSCEVASESSPHKTRERHGGAIINGQTGVVGDVSSFRVYRLSSRKENARASPLYVQKRKPPIPEKNLGKALRPIATQELVKEKSRPFAFS